MDDERDLIDQCNATGFGIPIFIMTSHALSVSPTMIKSVYHIVNVTDTDSEELYEHELDHAATEYEDSVLPPFFKAVVNYSQRGNLQFVRQAIKEVCTSGKHQQDVNIMTSSIKTSSVQIPPVQILVSVISLLTKDQH